MKNLKSIFLICGSSLLISNVYAEITCTPDYLGRPGIVCFSDKADDPDMKKAGVGNMLYVVTESGGYYVEGPDASESVPLIKKAVESKVKNKSR